MYLSKTWKTLIVSSVFPLWMKTISPFLRWWYCDHFSLEIDFILSPHCSINYHIQQRVLNNSGGQRCQFHFFGNRVRYHSNDWRNTTKKHEPRRLSRKLMQGKAKIKFHFSLFTFYLIIQKWNVKNILQSKFSCWQEKTEHTPPFL